jgi:two-component system CheB/CheR fusion protein
MERLRAEAAREKKMAEDLAEADRRKDEFLAMLGHELRNPLTPILNCLHVMRRYQPGGSEFEANRRILERQVRHMGRLVDDLLDISRITRGKIQLRVEPVELAGVVERAVAATRPLVEGRRHDLRVALPAEPVWLEADPTRLEQVLANLLNNATKYTEPGGRIELTAAREGREVVLRVRDNGIGITPDLLPRVFELFMQADRSLDRAQGGLGIGLTLVHRLVELHGGRVEAHSAGPGRGSEFIVRLPLPAGSASPQTPADEAPPEPASPGRRSTRVLVVDDNRDSAESLAMMFGLDGHEVHLAYDGPAAVEAALAYRPEVIFLDIGLPGLDGYEVARRLRGMPELAGVLLVAMTGYGQEEDRRRCRDAGFDLHLVKPVDPVTLRELLASPGSFAQ